MASIFGHAFVSVALGKSFPKKHQTFKLFLIAIICAVLPDADVIGLQFGISYGSFWGHRGFSHSILFALLLGIIVTFIFYRKQLFTTKGLILLLFFFLCTASHSILDAMTSGGKGVAFFSPFNNARYFFPWRPIKVSPIGISRFFSERGVKVILSELIWIGIPGLIYMTIIFTIRKFRKNN
ncbi:metal-dependent hydrolase [Polaribacter sp.]|uniref:metal-dependent hydrolase n=1 Tax=Polaribacter sp. TaxID=1920175 RepID=UPI003EFA695B